MGIFNQELRCVCYYRVRRIVLFRRVCADCRRNPECRGVNCRRNPECRGVNCFEVADRFEDAESMLVNEYDQWKRLRRMGLNIPAGNPRYLEAEARQELANLLLEGGYSGLAMEIAFPQPDRQPHPVAVQQLGVER